MHSWILTWFCFSCCDAAGTLSQRIWLLVSLFMLSVKGSRSVRRKLFLFLSITLYLQLVRSRDSSWIIKYYVDNSSCTYELNLFLQPHWCLPFMRKIRTMMAFFTWLTAGRTLSVPTKFNNLSYINYVNRCCKLCCL